MMIHQTTARCWAALEKRAWLMEDEATPGAKRRRVRGIVLALVAGLLAGGVLPAEVGAPLADLARALFG